MKNIPQRTCTVCRMQKNKNELLRIVKNKENIIKVDVKGKEPGRGAYICYNEECYKKAKKTKRLEKVLDIEIKDDIYEEIKNTIDRKVGGDVIG
mgnify:CR=1 FL=1